MRRAGNDLNEAEWRKRIKDAFLDLGRQLGRTPGRRPFLEYIKKDDPSVSQATFRGGLWVGWREFVLDCNAKPNTPPQALDGAFVVKKAAELAMGLNPVAIPTYAQLRFAKKSDPSFPSISHPLLRTQVLVREFRKLALADSGRYAALLSIPTVNDSEEVAPDVRRPGWVYMATEGTLWKIGQADDVDRRIARFNSSQPARTVRCVHAFQTDDMDGIE